MALDLYLHLKDIRENIGLYIVLTPELLKDELSRRGFEKADSIARVMEEAHDQFVITRTKPRLNELKDMASLISKYSGLDTKWVLNVLNDFNDCIFGM